MTDMKRKTITDGLTVSGQLRPEDLGELMACGVTTIVNNRPDKEEAEQPLSADLHRAARDLGLDYHHIPVTPGAPDPSDGQRMAQIVAEAKGNVHAFCRTGNRSSQLFALGQG